VEEVKNADYSHVLLTALMPPQQDAVNSSSIKCLDNTYEESYTLAIECDMPGRRAVFLHGAMVYIIHYAVGMAWVSL
jgi:hypothetical protein